MMNINCLQRTFFLLLNYTMLWCFCLLFLCVHSFSSNQSGILFVQVPVLNEPPANGLTGIPAPGHYIDGCRIALLSTENNSLTVLTEEFVSACDPTVSFDGQSIYFAGKKTSSDSYQIWKMNPDGTHKTQITKTITDCRSPLCVGDLFHLNDAKPTEKLLFTSSAHGWKDSYGNPIYSLYTCNLDGSDPFRISYNPGSDLYPSVLPNGKIVYSSWQWDTDDNVEKPANGKFSLFSLCIDGTEIYPFCISDDQSFVMSHTAQESVLFIATGFQDWLGGGKLFNVRKRHPFQANRLTEDSPSSNYMKLYHSPCEYNNDSMLVSYKFDNDHPNYSLVLLSNHDGTVQQTIYQHNDWHCIDAQILSPHPKVHGRSSFVQREKDTGVFYGLNVYTSDVPALQSSTQDLIHNIQVIQNNPQTQQEETIGTAPVESDGSFHIRVPASVPLRFALLDQSGKSIASQITWTWVMPGESRGCIGCHEDPHLTPVNLFPQAIAKPAVELAGLKQEPQNNAQLTPTFPQYIDVTTEAGIAFQHRFGDEDLSNIVESNGAGCAFFDYDNDGDLDLYFVNGAYLPEVNHIRGRIYKDRLSNALYRNNGDGTFTDVSVESGTGDKGFGMGCQAADYDNDGDKDLFVTNYGPNVFYRNNGDGTFTDITNEAGVSSDLWGIGCVFFDYDRDGFLDLYVGNYITFDPEYRLYFAADAFPGPLSYHGQPDILYHNNRDGTFTDVTEEAGVYNPDGRAMGIAACDYDQDGDMDVFVSNDAMENYLYQNNGDGTFENIALFAGVGFGQNGEATSAMGAEFCDFNLDGFMDILVPDMNYSCIYQNNNDIIFEDMSNQKGLASACGQYTSWSGNCFDFDLDGYTDVFISNGDAHHLEAEENMILRNINGETFRDVSALCGPGLEHKAVSRGAAVGDYDLDGDLDIAVLNINGEAKLLRADRSDGHNWLLLDIRGTVSNRDALGTKIRLTADGITQIREMTASSGYLSQSGHHVHFGLANCNVIDEITVTWLSGKQVTLNNIPVNQILSIIEPENE